LTAAWTPLPRKRFFAVDALGEHFCGCGGVAQFDGLVLAVLAPEATCGASEGAAGEFHVDFDGRIAAGKSMISRAVMAVIVVFHGRVLDGPEKDTESEQTSGGGEAETGK